MVTIVFIVYFGTRFNDHNTSFLHPRHINCYHLFIHSFIHSAISIAPLQVLYYSEALPTTARIMYRSFTVGKGLAQGPYMAARAGVEPTTLRLKAIDSTKASHD